MNDYCAKFCSRKSSGVDSYHELTNKDTNTQTHTKFFNFV